MQLPGLLGAASFLGWTSCPAHSCGHLLPSPCSQRIRCVCVLPTFPHASHMPSHSISHTHTPQVLTHVPLPPCPPLKPRLSHTPLVQPFCLLCLFVAPMPFESPQSSRSCVQVELTGGQQGRMHREACPRPLPPVPVLLRKRTTAPLSTVVSGPGALFPQHCLCFGRTPAPQCWWPHARTPPASPRSLQEAGGPAALRGLVRISSSLKGYRSWAGRLQAPRGHTEERLPLTLPRTLGGVHGPPVQGHCWPPRTAPAAWKRGCEGAGSLQ